LSGKTLQFCWKEAKCKYYRSINTTFGRLGNYSYDNVILNLVNSQALPQLTYGIASSTLNKSGIKEPSRAYNSIFVKLFKIKDDNVIYQCQFYCGFLCFSMLYDYSRILFLDKLIRTGVMQRHCLVDKREFADFENLHRRYGIKVNDSKVDVKNKVWNAFKVFAGI